MQQYTNFVADYTGKPLGNGAVVVKNYPSLTTATVYSTNGTGAPIVQPILTGNDGSLSFYAADGRYQIQITASNGRVTTISDVIFDDPNNDTANFDTRYLQLSTASAVYETQSHAVSSYLTISTATSSSGAAHIGSSPTGSFAESNVQGNLNELDKTKHLHVHTVLPLGTSAPRQMAEDSTYFYIIHNVISPVVTRVRKSDLTVQGALTLSPPGTVAAGGIAIVIDTTNNFLYISIGSVPASVVKVNTATFTQTATLQLSGDWGGGMAIDVSNQLLYIGTVYTNTTTGPDYINKVSLASFTVTGTILGNLSGVGGAAYNERGYYNLVIDFTTNTLYVGQDQGPGFQITKFNLTTFTRTSCLNAGTSYATGFLDIDSTNGFLYHVSTNISTATELSRISIASFTVSKSYTFPASYKPVVQQGGAIDIARKRLYLFGSYSDWAASIELPNLVVSQVLNLTNLYTISTLNYIGGYLGSDGFLYVLQYDNGLLYKWVK